MSIIPKLYITLFGEFSFSCEDKFLNERSRRSPKMWMLLQYLIIFREREVPQSELIELLWGKNPGENPVGTLKTRLHRLRNELSKLELNENIIINTHGSYAFNKALNYSIDAEEFEKLSILASKETDVFTRINYIMKAVNLYKGDFLPKISTESWVIPLNTYYRSLYTRITHDGVALLKAEDKPHEVISLCERAVLIDPYDEYLHGTLIETLARIGNKQGAKAHYDYVGDFFGKKLGTKPSKKLTSIYNAAMNTFENRAFGFSEVIRGLSEVKKGFGAFYCEYELFKHIYRLETRYMERSNRNISLFLITLGEDDAEYSDDYSKIMEKLGNAIKNSLRMSDVFARYSVCQYIILIHDAHEHNYELIVERIRKKFAKEHPNESNKFKTEFQLLKIPDGDFSGKL